MNIVALIPARGGSKGIPRKNVLSVAGQPLISWTIAAALGSKALSRVIVSTDDEEIAQVSKEHGAEVPFLRPPAMARDESGVLDAVLHALDWIESSSGACPDYLLLLQPTSPLRQTEDIDRAVAMAAEHDADAVLAVCEASPHPYLARRVDEHGLMTNFIPMEKEPVRRQDYPPAYVLNGAIYLNRCASLRKDRTFQPPGSLAYIMPLERSIDIDTPLDLRVADALLQS